MDKLIYTGDFLRRSKNDKLNVDVYNPSPKLVEAVNLAILLEQPLLLMGEPGSGKTRLAEAVAAELHGEKYKDYYFRWDIKSTSKAKEGIYLYDALRRLYDANTGDAKAKVIDDYITYGKLAEAIDKEPNGDLPNILLIDEIDKADIDFPNDLLLEIEKRELFIPELNRKVEKKSRVIIFITSNREKELPPAFLRRCLYYYINFPTESDLVKIISAKFNANGNERLIENAVNLFLDVRKKLEVQFAGNEKKPATSELLEWFQVISFYHNKKSEQNISEGVKSLIEIVENYQRDTLDELKEIPFPEALLKTWESFHLLAGK